MRLVDRTPYFFSLFNDSGIPRRKHRHRSLARQLHFSMQFPQSALPVLESGGQIVTANTRAARDLRRLYNENRRDHQSRQAWESPAIFDWNSWLDQQWQQLLLSGTEVRLLLKPVQEESLWADVVRSVVENRSLIAPREIARLARSAYHRLAAYGGLARLRLRDEQWLVGSQEPDVELQETEVFRRWAQDFERRCLQNGWLSASLLPAVLADAYQQNRLAEPSLIAWAGFDRITPAESALRDALLSAGCAQSDLTRDLQAHAQRIAARTPEQELEACALWVRDILRRQPQARVAVLFQDAEAMRAKVDQVFRRILTPERQGLGNDAAKPAYEFTLGIPLSDVPLVRAAMLLLRWLTQPLDREQITWLLGTGFIGDSDDAPLLAASDARIRREELLPPEQHLDQMLQRLERNRPSSAVLRWLVRLRRARASLALILSRERSCRQWVEAIDVFLETAGWPGTRALDSVNFQELERWRRLLEEVSALDFNEKRISFNDFLSALNTQARTAIFSAESEDAPVVISGIPESAGRSFDAIWMMQTTDEAWPAKSSPHPMLPWWLQADLRMPRGDAEEDTAFASKVMDRLRKSTPLLVASYALEAPYGVQRPSSLILEMRCEPAAIVTQPAPSTTLETFIDDAAIPWPGTRTAGGQEVLKRQAACAFQAFASKRLGGREDRSSEQGLDPAQRGTFLHTVLQTLWKDSRMQGSAGLRSAVANGSLPSLIEEHVTRAIAKFNAEGSWEKAYLQLESQRLCFLIHDWLLLHELKRSPFVVEAEEEKKIIDIAGLQLEVRLDRVDKLIDGEKTRRVLIDYKTGEMKRSKWDSPRMDEPQLPLYAVGGNVENLTNIAFAQLRPGKLRFIDALAGNGFYLFPANENQKTADADFDSILAEWTEDLTDLSRKFQDGVASVDPKVYPTTCTYCAFSGLCRVSEIESISESGGEEE